MYSTIPNGVLYMHVLILYGAHVLYGVRSTVQYCTYLEHASI